MPKQTRICVMCGNGFIGKYSGRRGNIVCSEECRRKRITESKLKGKNLTCKTCGVEFWARPHRIDNNAQYCTPECWKKSIENPMVEMNCLHCGEKFLAKPTTVHIRKYCSKSCRSTAETRRVKVNCVICANEFEKTPSWANRHKNHLCSSGCVKTYFLTRIVFYQSHCNTKPERLFNEQTPIHIEQTSDGKFFINFTNGRVKNPDFIVRPVKETKKVIEIFGRYWHKAEEEAELIEKYNEVGYQCLVIWEEEVYKGTYHDKLQRFLSS